MENRANDLDTRLDELKKQHELVLAEIRGLMVGLGKSRGNSAFAVKVNSSFSEIESLLRDHQVEEEVVLLPIVNKYLGQDVSRAVRDEHDQIAQGLKEIRKLVSRVGKTAMKEPLLKLQAALVEFEALAREHFSREENVLFWYTSLAERTSGAVT